jgi:trigger factor
MQISINETGPCELTVHYECGSEQIDAKMADVLKSFEKAPVRGFRPGSKPSLDAIKMQYRQQINEALKRALAEQSFHDTLFEHNIKPLGTPNFTNLSLLANKFSCDFSLRKKPDFELHPYKDLTIPKQPMSQSINDMAQQMLQELRVKCGDVVPFAPDDPVQMGDSIVIDYQAFDGEISLDNLNGTQQTLIVGKIGLPGFDDALLGMKLDEERSFDILIPEGGLPSVVGKNIKFVVKLSGASKITPCPLNDELAVRIGQKDYQALFDMITVAASNRHTETLRAAHLKQITARLVADNQIAVPPWLILSEAQYLAASAQLQWDLLSIEDRERFLQAAEGNVKLSLILDKIREVEPEAQLSDYEVLEMVKQNAVKTGQDPNQVLEELNKNGSLTILASRIRDEYTLDFVLKHTNIIE